MINLYNDYPESYNKATIDALNHEYKTRKTPLSFWELLQKEQEMQSKILQNETDTPQTTPPNNTPSNNSQPEQPPTDFRLYSLISSNYCNLTNLFNNIISKTSSSKREAYQEINASLRVDQTTFNNTFNTVCNMEGGNFCNYNQLIYTSISNFIDLVDNLSSLALLSTQDQDIVLRLRNNTFNLFRAFINEHPIRY